MQVYFLLFRILQPYWCTQILFPCLYANKLSGTFSWRALKIIVNTSKLFCSSAGLVVIPSEKYLIALFV